MASSSNPSRGRRSAPQTLGRTRVISTKLRQSDARWRASIQACYTLLRPVLQSRQPSLSRAPRPRVLEATRQHVLELERALAMLLDMKNNVIQSLFDDPPPPQLTVEQYKTLFRGLYPLEAPVADPSCRTAWSCCCAARAANTAAGPAGDGSPATPTGPPNGPPTAPPTGPRAAPSDQLSGADDPPTEPDLAELASLLHDAYDATDGQLADMPPAGPLPGGGNMAAPTPLEEAAMVSAARLEGGVDVPPLAATAGPGLDMPLLDGLEEAAAAPMVSEALPDVEDNLSLDLPSLEVSNVWGDCVMEGSEPNVAWQELERAAQSLSVPAQLEDFTQIQRSDWGLDNDMPSDSAPPLSHLSPFSPEMALPAFCSTPDGAEGDGSSHALITPPPGASRAKRAGSGAACRRADRCRRALTLTNL